MKNNRLVAALATALFAACAEGPTEFTPITELPRPLTASEQEVITASNTFAFELFREINASEPGANVFISPLSASMALGMTLNGARGETFDAMRGTLGFEGLTQHEVNASYRGLIDLLRGLDPQVEMLIGNSIWYRDPFPFHQAFFDTTSAYFDARVAGLDFTDPASVNVINDWVKESTDGKIESVLDRIEPDDVMYLINAIYFKGDWTRQFDKQDTRDAPFYDGEGEQVVATIPMMHRRGPLLHARGPNFQAADLPYGNTAFSMMVILPDIGVPVDDVIASLDPQRWRDLTEDFSEANLEIYLPKFRLEYAKNLNDVLIALGMGPAFDPRVADFNGMSPLGDALYISRVFQQTYVYVNEAGTEAAAATSVGVGVVSLPPIFRVDRPFIFAIRERFSGTILFIGTVVQPAR
ncbi:serpin family protein [soil metagenome]